MSEKNKNIENHIIEIIKLLDNKIKSKYVSYQKEIKEKDGLQKELNETQLKLMRLELLKEALLSGNSKNINAYNATQTSNKNKLKPNFNRLKSSNISGIQTQIENQRTEMNRVTQELSNKNDKLEDLRKKMSSILEILNKLSQKIKNNSKAQKNMINNIYKSTRVKSVLNILNAYYGEKEKPMRNVPSNQLIQ